MDKSLKIIHRGNKLMVFLLTSFYLVSIVINLLIEEISFILPPVGLIFCAILSFLVYKKKYIRLTMHLTVWLTFLYFFYIITYYPYLVNYIFMWLGLVLSSLYQNYRIIIVAGVLSLLLTFYSFFGFHEEIFPGVATLDIVYLISFGVFVTIYLILYSQFTLNLWIKAQKSEEKLKNILESVNIMTFSYDAKIGKRVITSEIKTGLLFDQESSPSCNLICYKNIHPDDMEALKLAEKEILQGVGKSIEYRLLLPDKSQMWLRAHYVPVFDQGQQLISIEGVVVDITEEKNFQERMKYMAYHDHLTGLPNRSLLNDYFKEVIADDQNEDILSEGSLYVFFIDLDSFKEINDTYGHEIGDRLLIIVAMRLQSTIRETDMLSRLGGDEFVGILTGVTREEVERVVGRIKKALATPISIDDHHLTITPSIGISEYNKESGGDLDLLIKQADAAMYRAKQASKNDYRFY